MHSPALATEEGEDAKQDWAFRILIFFLSAAFLSGERSFFLETSSFPERRSTVVMCQSDTARSNIVRVISHLPTAVAVIPRPTSSSMGFRSIEQRLKRQQIQSLSGWSSVMECVHGGKEESQVRHHSSAEGSEWVLPCVRRMDVSIHSSP